MEEKPKTASLFVKVPVDLKLTLERIAFERTQAGQRTTLAQVVAEALREYVMRVAPDEGLR